MTFTIKHAENGIIVQATDRGRVVYQSNCEDDFDAFQAFLYELVEQFGPSEGNSRYSEKRIYIEVRPGDKYELTVSRPDAS